MWKGNVMVGSRAYVTGFQLNGKLDVNFFLLVIEKITVLRFSSISLTGMENVCFIVNLS